MKKYYRDLDSYETQHDCDVAVCELVDKKFPGLLRDRKTPGIRSFDGVFTAREAFDHLDGEVGSTTAANEKFAVHLQSIIDRKYKPEQNGTKTYFAAVEHDRYKANSTKVATVTLEILLVYTQQAFRAAVDKHTMQDIENSWALVESANAIVFKDVEERYKQYKDHHTLHLRQLVLNVDTKKQHHPQAHAVASHGDMIAHMQGTMQSMVEEQNELREPYAHMVETTHSSRTGPPSVVATASPSINTSTSSNSAHTAAPTMSYNDVQEMIKKALQGVTPTGNNNMGSTSQQPYRPRKWRQWRSWCYTCGVNLNHNSINCKRTKCAGHDANPEATMENPLGGNVAKNRLWMK